MRNQSGISTHLFQPLPEMMKTNTMDKVSRYLYIAALICGIAPLTAGTVIFLLWLYSSDISLVTAGLKTVEVGTVVAVSGLIFLAIYAIIAYRCGMRPAAIARKSVKPLAIIASNFIVAPVLVVAGTVIATGYVITVENRSDLPIEGFYLLVPGGAIEFGALQPSETRTERFRIKKDGAIEYRYSQKGTCHAGVIEGYVTRMQGGKITVAVGEKGRIDLFDGITREHREPVPEDVPPQHEDEWTLPCMIPG